MQLATFYLMLVCSNMRIQLKCATCLVKSDVEMAHFCFVKFIDSFS